MLCAKMRVTILRYIILYWESMILGGSILQSPKIGVGQRKLRDGQPKKVGAVDLAVGSYLQRGSAPPPPTTPVDK